MQNNLQERIAEKVRRGDYESAEQLVQEAVERLLANDEDDLQELREKIQHAEDQIARGEYTDYNELTIKQLADRVKAVGRSRLASEKQTGTR
jgi:Arc/MetJ-type ribon-helix-helix transcriptional regulator